MHRRFARMLRRPLLAASAGALIFGSATALAGSGVGDVFNLGQTNTVGAASALSGETAAPQLTLKNTSTNTAATALNLVVAAGRTPFKVNSPVKVANLNADQLDGRDSTYFLAAKTGKAIDADKLDGQDSTAFLGASAKAADSNLLDGMDSTGFWKAGGNEGTSPKEDFLGTIDKQALELKVAGQRALRLEPETSPNLVGGYGGNSVDAGHLGSVVAGGGASGQANHVENDYDFIGAGFGNVVGTPSAGGASAIVAGTGNVASGGSAFIGAGADSTASANYAFVGAGQSNTASGSQSVVAGGYINTASGDYSAVAGGSSNTASGSLSAVAGGTANTSSGSFSAVAGGVANTASGADSFAAGTHAQATQNGSFVWGDGTFTDVTSPAANTFTVRAKGGIWLGTHSSPSITAGHFIDTSTGGYLSSGGAWTDASDRALKHDFRPLSKRTVLERVARMPIQSWSYKAEQPSVRHIGPTAQDFHKAFGLGLDDKHIATLDESGVALAAIQGLYRQNRALERQNRALTVRLARLERMVSRLSAGGR